MPIEPRILGDDIHYHVILRCNNKERLFKKGKDFEGMLVLLQEVQDKFRFRLYNYDLLNSHIHLMLSTHQGHFLDKIMHLFCLNCAKKFNKDHARSGHLWAHRYRSRVMMDDRYALACLRYQNRNALSAGLVSKPEEWPWSGYHFYAHGSPNHLVEPHPSYLAIHEDPIKRRVAYRQLVNTPIPADKIPNLLEKGSGKMTKRVRAMMEQTERLKRKIPT